MTLHVALTTLGFLVWAVGFNAASLRTRNAALAMVAGTALAGIGLVPSW